MAVLFVTATGASLRVATRLLVVLLVLTSLINVLYLGSHLMQSLHPNPSSSSSPTTYFGSGLVVVDADGPRRRASSSSVELIEDLFHVRNRIGGLISTASGATATANTAVDPSSSSSSNVVMDDDIDVQDSSSEYDANKDLDDRFSEGHDEAPVPQGGAGGRSEEEEEQRSEDLESVDGPVDSGEDGRVHPMAGQLLADEEEEEGGVEDLDRNRNRQFPRNWDKAAGTVGGAGIIGSDGGNTVGKVSKGNGRFFNKRYVGRNSDGSLSSGKEPVLALLEKAGINRTDLDAATLEELPTWEQIQSLYYKPSVGRPDVDPIVHGLDTCEWYRKSIPVESQFFGVAGLFNTGTNALDWALSHNIEERMTRWQVPWGKHRLAQVKWNHTVEDDWGMYNKTNVMPIIIIKDPFSWMQSMCGTAYSAVWRHSEAHCPNLVPGDYERAHYPQLARRKSVPVRIEFDRTSVGHWDSLVHLWNDWYRQYYDAEYPRLMIRFEDLLFAPDRLLELIAGCVGTDVVKPVRYRATTAKDHGSHTDLVRAMIKHGGGGGGGRDFRRGELRTSNMTADDVAFADKELDAVLMRHFQYRPGNSGPLIATQ